MSLLTTLWIKQSITKQARSLSPPTRVATDYWVSEPKPPKNIKWYNKTRSSTQFHLHDILYLAQPGFSVYSAHTNFFLLLSLNTNFFLMCLTSISFQVWVHLAWRNNSSRIWRVNLFSLAKINKIHRAGIWKDNKSRYKWELTSNTNFSGEGLSAE